MAACRSTRSFALRGGTDVLVATRPSSDVLEHNGACIERVSTLLLDEADRLLADAFAFEMDSIMERLPPPTARQTLCLARPTPSRRAPR